MKKVTTLALLLLVFSCIYAQKTKQPPIVGTWRLVDFADFDTTTNVWCIATEKILKAILLILQVVY